MPHVPVPDGRSRAEIITRALLQNKIDELLDRRTARIYDGQQAEASDEKTMRRLVDAFGQEYVLEAIERYRDKNEGAASGLQQGPGRTKVGWGQLKLALGEDVLRRIMSES